MELLPDAVAKTLPGIKVNRLKVNRHLGNSLLFAMFRLAICRGRERWRFSTIPSGLPLQR